MLSDSDDDDSPAMVFSRGVKPVPRKLPRVLEEESPLSAQQAFATVERGVLLQEQRKVFHCAGGLLPPQSAAAAASCGALQPLSAVAQAAWGAITPGAVPQGWIGSQGGTHAQEQQQPQPHHSAVRSAEGRQQDNGSAAAGAGAGVAAIPAAALRQQQQQQQAPSASPIGVASRMPSAAVQSGSPTVSTGLQLGQPISGDCCQQTSSDRSTPDQLTGEAAAADVRALTTPTLLPRQVQIGDPFTPWLCTSTKQVAGSGSLVSSPLSIRSRGSGSGSGSGSSSIVRCWTDGLQLGQQRRTVASHDNPLAPPLGLVSRASPQGTGCLNMQLHFTPMWHNNSLNTCSSAAESSCSHATTNASPCETPTTAAAAAVAEPQEASGHRIGSGGRSSSDEDEDDCLLTFTRTRQRRTTLCRTAVGSCLFRMHSDGDSSSKGDSDGSSNDSGESDSSWSDADSTGTQAGSSSSRSGCTTRDRSAVVSKVSGPLDCSKHGCSNSSHSTPRLGSGPGSCSCLTPGSSGSLVARRRRRLQSPAAVSWISQRSQQSGLENIPAADPYDCDSLELVGMHDSARQQQQQQHWQEDVGWSPSRGTATPITPVSASGAGSSLQSAAAGSEGMKAVALPASPAPLQPHAAAGRRLSIAPGADTVTSGAAAAAAGGASGRRAGGRAGGAAGTGAGQRLGCMTAPAKAPSSRTFARQRQQLSQQLYDQWNAQVFDGSLLAVPLVWNPRLTSTAGQVVDDGSQDRLKASKEERVPVRLELSSKVLDCEARLRTTLAHEMCHVAAWAVSREFKQHHGPAFWAWARRFEARAPGIRVTTCHNYEVHAPFRWQCANNSCGKQYHRHKRSIDPAKHVCSRCSSRLLYLGKFSRDGKLVGSAAVTAATPGGTPGGNTFSQFVKTHFARTKRELPVGTPHKELMSRLAADYKLHKASAQQQPASQQPASQQPAVQQQQHWQLADVLVEEAQAKVLQLPESECEPSSSGMQLMPPQQQQGRRDAPSGQAVGGLLSFLQRLDLAGTE